MPASERKPVRLERDHSAKDAAAAVRKASATEADSNAEALHAAARSRDADPGGSGDGKTARPAIALPAQASAAVRHVRRSAAEADAESAAPLARVQTLEAMLDTRADELGLGDVGVGSAAVARGAAAKIQLLIVNARAARRARRARCRARRVRRRARRA